MTTVVFIHGTGVRQPQYDQTLRQIEQRLQEQLPDLQVAPCFWGEDFGAKLHSLGASIPLYDTTLALGEEEEQQDVVLWEQLYRNPLYELQLLSVKPRDEGAANPWEESPGEQLQSRLESLTPSEPLQAKFEEAGIAEVFESARQSIINSQAYYQAMVRAAEPLGEYCDALSRGIVAQAMVYCEEQSQYPPVLTDAQLRDEVVQLLSSALGDGDLGIGGWIGSKLLQLAMPTVTAQIKQKRGAITSTVSPMSGDILLYLSRGEGIRSFIRETIEQVESPVVLLAHSLGGIACVDLLVQECLPQVQLLVTVGSQAPFLYEINALHSLKYGESLPDYFPDWLNIYDLRDFLSYIGANVFPNKVQDILVDNQQPFVRSHSAYWTNPSTWKAIVKRIKN
ncbi:MAG: hypothetical protein F6K31_26285 [Symploca sp. SIO2G7]|nr:hypothetical protein [Symploca sp. SIO2G7]